MKKSESLEQFYQHHAISPFDIREELNKVPSGSFNVYRRSRFTCNQHMASSRRDYFKISLIVGTGVLSYANRSIEVKACALLYSNPDIPYSWQATSEQQEGFFCVFTEDLLLESSHNQQLSNSPLFKIGGNPIFFLQQESIEFITVLFEKMLVEVSSDYPQKGRMLRSYIDLIMHEALKMQPANVYFKAESASFRTAALFTELLEKQFPITSVQDVLKLKSPNDYAACMSIHTNHLNRAVKEVTGKTTTRVIAERIMQEAKSLLKHTQWNNYQIAYCLGFEEPAYFNDQFKKYAQLTPKEYRRK